MIRLSLIFLLGFTMLISFSVQAHDRNGHERKKHGSHHKKHHGRHHAPVHHKHGHRHEGYYRHGRYVEFYASSYDIRANVRGYAPGEFVFVYQQNPPVRRVYR